MEKFVLVAFFTISLSLFFHSVLCVCIWIQLCRKTLLLFHINIISNIIFIVIVIQYRELFAVWVLFGFSHFNYKKAYVDFELAGAVFPRIQHYHQHFLVSVFLLLLIHIVNLCFSKCEIWVGKITAVFSIQCDCLRYFHWMSDFGLMHGLRVRLVFALFLVIFGWSKIPYSLMYNTREIEEAKKSNDLLLNW